MSWDLAPSLKVLRDQVNAAYPNRSKASDGTIGDAAHAATASDHNPNSSNIVCAFDITHDPAHGFDANVFLNAQLKNPQSTLKYMVWQGHIYSRKYNWLKRPSSGHTSHIHVSVGVGSDGKSLPGTYNDTTKWVLGNGSNDGGSTVPEEMFKVYDIKSSKLVTVKVKTGNNGAGYTDIRLDKANLMIAGHGWAGNSAKDLSCAVENKGGGLYRVAVEGAPGAYTISVNITLVEV